MKMIIEQLAQQARSVGAAGRQGERHSEAFQPAIDFYRLDVGRQPGLDRPAQAETGASAPSVIHPNI